MLSKYLKLILTRNIFLYLVCFLLLWRLLDYNALLRNTIPQTLSRLTPPIDYFTEFVDKKDHYNLFILTNCINYHKAVMHFYPVQKAEALGMLGFCYERLGKQSQSIEAYAQAIAANPDYFWPYYNLGVIYYRQGQYSKAADYFLQAIEREPVRTIVLLARSKVYNDVKLSKNNGPYDYLAGLKEGRTEAYILLMDSLSKTANYEQLWNIAIIGIKENPDEQSIFYYYAGLAAFYEKSYQKSAEFLQASLQNNPNNSDAFLYLSMCFQAVGREDLAKEILKKAYLLHEQGSDTIKPYLTAARVRFF